MPRHPAVRELSRHFYDALFDLGFLDVEGADSLRSAIAGVLAFLVASGLLLTRVLMGKYAALSASASPRIYEAALAGDDLLLLALPMLVGALAAVLLGPAMFPDETDFRVLVPLPIPRRVVFHAKLRALFRFAAVFTVGTLIALTPVVLLGALPRWATVPWLARVGAFWAAGLASTVFAMVAVAGLNGAILAWIPGAYRRVAGMLVRSGLLGAIVVSLPLVARLPALGPSVHEHRWAIQLLPPAWFLGVHRALTAAADPFAWRLAVIGVLAVAVAALITAACYATLYRRFDRVMLRAHRTLPPLVPLAGIAPAGHPTDIAVRRFTAATLRRSPLHQGALVGVCACGVALVLNGMAGFDWLELWRGAPPPRELAPAVLQATLTLVFVATSATRLALTLPAERRANWIFRLSETDAARPAALHAVARTLTRFGVLAPVAVMTPALLVAYGPSGVAVIASTVLVGLLLVEARLQAWDRVPFTCTWLPGKRNLAHTFLAGLVVFVAVTVGGAVAARLVTRGPVAAGVLCALLVAVIAGLGHRRRRRWRAIPLGFEDVSPYRVESMRLSVD
jgi:hypothetical protein